MLSQRITRAVAYAWAGPVSLPGLALGALVLLTGGRVASRRGVLEFHGGLARALLETRVVRAQAVTLGHVVLGRDEACLDRWRGHELVHVRQVERWGPLFVPAYVAASLWALATGRHHYRDNWFEREAVRRSASRPT